MGDDVVGFEEWLRRVFDAEGQRQREAHRMPDGMEPGAWYTPESYQAACRYMIRAFEDADATLGRYSDDELARGLKCLLMGSFTDVLKLFPEEVELLERERLLRSTVTLFSDVLFPRCEQMLRADPEAARHSKLDYVVFMFWDMLEVTKDPEYPGMDEVHTAGLESLEKILHLPNDLTQFAALHGLGHAAKGYPKKAAAIIDRWLATDPVLGPGMLEYAQQARVGEVL